MLKLEFPTFLRNSLSAISHIQTINRCFLIDSLYQMSLEQELPSTFSAFTLTAIKFKMTLVNQILALPPDVWRLLEKYLTPCVGFRASVIIITTTILKNKIGWYRDLLCIRPYSEDTCDSSTHFSVLQEETIMGMIWCVRVWSLREVKQLRLPSSKWQSQNLNSVGNRKAAFPSCTQLSRLSLHLAKCENAGRETISSWWVFWAWLMPKLYQYASIVVYY